MGRTTMDAGHSERDARARIVAAARRNLLQGGEGRASSGRIAADVGVSKALVHYHFPNKQALFLAVIAGCAGATAPPNESGEGDAIQQCREWIVGELRSRDLELLLQLARSEDDHVAGAARDALGMFRETVGRQVHRMLHALEMKLTVRADVVVDLIATVVLGLAATEPDLREEDRAQILDALWLAMLSLAR